MVLNVKPEELTEFEAEVKRDSIASDPDPARLSNCLRHGTRTDFILRPLVDCTTISTIATSVAHPFTIERDIEPQVLFLSRVCRLAATEMRPANRPRRVDHDSAPLGTHRPYLPVAYRSLTPITPYRPLHDRFTSAEPR